MLVDLDDIVKLYIPTALDYAHPKIWYRIYISSDDNKHPEDLEHIKSLKTLRQVYCYAIGDMYSLIHCCESGDAIEEIDGPESYIKVYNNIDYDRCEYKISKLRPKDIKLGYLIQFESFRNDSDRGYIRKIHTNFYEKDYKYEDGCGRIYGTSTYDDLDDDTYERSIATTDVGENMHEYPKEYSKEAEKFVILD